MDNEQQAIDEVVAALRCLVVNDNRTWDMWNDAKQALAKYDRVTKKSIKRLGFIEGFKEGRE